MLISIFEGLKEFWGYAEPLVWIAGLTFAAFLFLKDQVRRDRFFGYIPTVITVVYDPKARKLLICYLNGGKNLWIFPQGRIEDSILGAARDVLRQEIKLERAFKLGGSFYLGRNKLRAEGKTRLQRFMDPAEWTLARQWRGKAYTALQVETSIEHARRELDGSFLYECGGFVSFAEARKLLSQGHRPEKAKIYMQIIDLLEKEVQAK